MRQLLALLVLAITVYGIVDCAQADARTRRGLPLWAWVLLMVALPGLGAIIWLLVSRLGPADTAPRTRSVAPDDDPEFLRELERRRRAGRGEDGRRPEGSTDGTHDPDGEGAPGRSA